MNGTGIFLCNFSGMIKNVLPSLRQGAARKGSAADKTASAAALPGTPSRKPRTRGEKYRENAEAMRVQGSPPRMRGKVGFGVAVQIQHGITPAHAGKSVQRLLHSYNPRNHPRTCGEKELRAANQNFPMGLPPHMRGKVFLIILQHLHGGITPAYAGKRRCTRFRP